MRERNESDEREDESMHATAGAVSLFGLLRRCNLIRAATIFERERRKRRLWIRDILCACLLGDIDTIYCIYRDDVI